MGKSNILQLVYSVSSKGEERLYSVSMKAKYSNEKKADFIKRKPKKTLLSLFEQSLLEKKPSNIKLSIGTFKFDTELIEIIGSSDAIHYVWYKKVKK